MISEVRAHVWGEEEGERGGVLTSCKANSLQLNWLPVSICNSIFCFRPFEVFCIQLTNAFICFYLRIQLSNVRCTIHKLEMLILLHCCLNLFDIACTINEDNSKCIRRLFIEPSFCSNFGVHFQEFVVLYCIVVEAIINLLEFVTISERSWSLFETMIMWLIDRGTTR